MNNIIEIFKEAFDQSVDDYKKGLINSERCLQSALYFHIRNQIPEQEEKDIKILLEPVLTCEVGDLKGKQPDLLICDGKKILLIAELKFLPHYRPVWKKDVIKLKQIFDASKQNQFKTKLSLSANGKYDNVIYEPDDNIALCFVVFGRDDAEAVNYDSVSRQWAKLNFFACITHEDENSIPEKVMKPE